MQRTPPSSDQATQDRPTPVPQNRPVTQYHLSAEGVRIVFHDGTPDTASLEYNDKVYRGRALYHEHAAVGRIISINLETMPDLHTVFLSLAVPEANCPSDARSVPIHTFAVITTVRTSIGGPALVSGQIRTYKVVPLEGNAW